MKLSSRTAVAPLVIVVLVGVVLVGVALVGAFVAIRAQSASDAPLNAPLAAPVGMAPDAPRGIYGIGTIEARIQSDIGFEVAGTLMDLAVDQGGVVVQGQVLARLDDREQVAAVAVAEAGLAEAGAALSQAQARLERARAVERQKRSINQRRQSLAKRGTVSDEVAEDSQAASHTAAADVAVALADVQAAQARGAAAQAGLDREQQRLAKYALTAPYDGLVVRRDRELGAAVTAGSPVFTVIDPASIWVRAYIDEAQAGKLASGGAAKIALRSLPGVQFPGRIARIDIESDRVSEERIVHVAFDTLPQTLHLGEQAEVVLDEMP